MKNFLRPVLFSVLIAGGVSASAQSTPAYVFRHQSTPRFIETYSNTLFSASDHSMETMRGDLLGYEFKETITDFASDPVGRMVACVAVNKKGEPKVVVTSTVDRNRQVFKYNAKRYGIPSAIAFTSDGRSLMIATDKGIHFFSIPKFELQSTMVAPGFAIRSMKVSDNGFFMAAEGEDKVALYNMEQRSLRHTFDCGEKVNDVAFSHDSDYLAILTADGLLEIYYTNTLRLRTSIEDLGEGLACDFNSNGKYIAVATSPAIIELINLVKPDDRKTLAQSDGFVNDLSFLSDAFGNTLLGFTGPMSLRAERLRNLEPYYSKLVSDEADRMMAEWMKMQPGETMEEYSARVSDKSRAERRRLYEDQAATSLAGDLVSMAEMSLGAYDRSSQRLAVEFSNLPTIYLPVPEASVGAFHNGSDLTVTDARYGVMPDDGFELIYAHFHNRNNNETYIYDNQDRVPMAFLEGDDNVVSLEVLQQQQMEEMRLQELKEKVVAQAKHDNIISDHTQITVDSQVVPAYDAAGNKILNYIVAVEYTVDPEFSAIEDFGPGKYHISESGAAKSMLEIVQKAMEGDMAQYLQPGRRVRVKLSGSADATPIVNGIPYDGSFGDFEEEPVVQNGQLAPLSVTKRSGIKTNEQLAFLRATAVKDWLNSNIPALKDVQTDYTVNVDVSQDKGSEHRRIKSEFTFVDVFGE